MWGVISFQDKQDSFRRAGASFWGHERNRFFLNQGAEGWLEVTYLLVWHFPRDCRNVVVRIWTQRKARFMCHFV